jgi:NADH-quinone oxidoreductase subunit N
LLMGIMSAYDKTSNSTDNAVLYYSIAYGISTVAAFAVAIVVAGNTGSDKTEAFNGLAKRKPMLAAALTIAMLSLAGIPPFAGFFGKYYIFTEAIMHGHVALTVVAVINSIVGVYYYFKVIVAMYTKDSGEVVFNIKPSYSFVVGLCILLIVLIGLFPSVFSGLL